MQCPPVIAESLVEIIRHSILMIRIYGNQGDSTRCAIEANHIHNLPKLLIEYSDDLLKYYWEIERVSYISQVKDVELSEFKKEWVKIKKYIDNL